MTNVGPGVFEAVGVEDGDVVEVELVQLAVVSRVRQQLVEHPRRRRRRDPLAGVNV